MIRGERPAYAMGEDRRKHAQVKRNALQFHTPTNQELVVRKSLKTNNVKQPVEEVERFFSPRQQIPKRKRFSRSTKQEELQQSNAFKTTNKTEPLKLIVTTRTSRSKIKTRIIHLGESMRFPLIKTNTRKQFTSQRSFRTAGNQREKGMIHFSGLACFVINDFWCLQARGFKSPMRWC